MTAATGFAAFVSLALMSAPARAPIFGVYSGLSEMMRGADAIVVARITSEAERRAAMGGFEDYTVRILYTLKGDVSRDSAMKVSLRHLPLLPPPVSDAGGPPMLSDSALGRPFQVSERYVLFLEREGYLFGKYHNRNSAGSAFWVAPTFDPSKLNVDDVRGNIETLVAEVVDYERLRARNLDDVAAEYLAN
jgi:hypothetical protein